MLKAVKIISILVLAISIMAFGPSKHKQGRKHLENGDYTRALEALTDALNESPDKPEIHRDIGITYYKTRQYEQALSELDKAKQKLDKDGNVMFYLGLTYERLKQYDKAIEEYSNYVNLGRFDGIKETIQKRIYQLIPKQAEQWAKERMEFEQQIDAASIPDNSIAVTYFKPFSVSEELEPLHKGLTDLIIMDLLMIDDLRVLERERMKEIYEELGLGSTDLVDQNTAPRMGKLLGASTLVTGAFTGLGEDKWRIDPTLGLVKAGEFQKLGSVEGEIPGFMQVEKELVLKVLDSLGIELTPEQRESILQNVPTESLQAFLAYSRGLNYMDNGMYEAAMREFESAISLDPGFTQAEEHLTGAQFLSEPTASIGDLKSLWNSVISSDAGKNELLGMTLGDIGQGDIDRVPVSEIGEPEPVDEISLEVIIRW